MNLEKISNLIKTKRKEKNLTQEELAIKLNVTEKAISRWETGRGTPDISLLIPLSKELDVSISQLLSGEDNNPSNDSDKINEIIEYIDINKKHKNTKFLIIGIIIYIITLICYLLYLKNEYRNASSYIYYSQIYGPGIYNNQIFYSWEIFANMFFIFLTIVANSVISNYYFDKLRDKSKMKIITYVVILVIYIIMILNMTIFTRQIYKRGYNLIPFKTIINYIINFSHYSLEIPIRNILGNIFLLMPIQYLIIKIFNLKKFKLIFFIDSIIVLVNELLPFILQTKIFDIDHIILNLLGMLIVCFLIKLKNRKKDN